LQADNSFAALAYKSSEANKKRVRPGSMGHCSTIIWSGMTSLRRMDVLDGRKKVVESD
jgi:hypothetical protein